METEYIQTLIEREAEEYRDREWEKVKDYNKYTYTFEEVSVFCKEDYAQGFKDALSLFKWRKVSDGLPDVSECEDKKCDFLAKTDYGYDIVTYYDDPKFLVGWFANALRRNVTEWMYIPKINNKING